MMSWRLASALVALLEQPEEPASAYSGELPEWVLQLTREAVARGLRPSHLEDVAKLATRAGLPLSTVMRAVREVVTA